mmetsp:Transcript_5434/g.17077  ORF Transcript_5434/g.17077 Transcript_5434/m.17077 type:complete len:294 (-) Transcript_5434:35-916(-)
MTKHRPHAPVPTRGQLPVRGQGAPVPPAARAPHNCPRPPLLHIEPPAPPPSTLPWSPPPPPPDPHAGKFAAGRSRIIGNGGGCAARGMGGRRGEWARGTPSACSRDTGGEEWRCGGAAAHRHVSHFWRGRRRCQRGVGGGGSRCLASAGDAWERLLAGRGGMAGERRESGEAGAALAAAASRATASRESASREYSAGKTALPRPGEARWEKREDESDGRRDKQGCEGGEGRGDWCRGWAVRRAMSVLPPSARTALPPRPEAGDRATGLVHPPLPPSVAGGSMGEVRRVVRGAG